MPVHYDDAHIRELGQLWISTGEMLQEAVGVMDGAVSSMAGGWTGKAGHAAEVVWNGVADHNIRHALLEAGTVAVEIGQAIINYADELQKAIDEINRAALIGALTTIFGMVLGIASFGIGAVLARLTSLVGQLVQSIASSISRIAAAAANVGRAAAFTADSVLNAGVTLGTDLFAGWLGSKAGHGPMHIDWESEGINMGLGVWTGWGMGGVDILKGQNTAAGGKGLPNIATPGPAPSPTKAPSVSATHAGSNIPHIGLPHVGDLAPFPNSVVQTNHAPPTGAGVTHPVTAAPGPNAGVPGNAAPLPGTVRPGQERPGAQTPGTARPDSPRPHPVPTPSADQATRGGQPPSTVRPGQTHPEGASSAVSGPASPTAVRPGEVRTEGASSAVSGPTSPTAVRPGEVRTGGRAPTATGPRTPVTPRPGEHGPHITGNDLATGTPSTAVGNNTPTPRTPHAFLDGPRSAGLPNAPVASPGPHGGAGAIRETAPTGPGGVPRTHSPRGEQNPLTTTTSHAPGSGDTLSRTTVTSHAGTPQAPLADVAADAGAGRITASPPHGTPDEGTRVPQPPARTPGSEPSSAPETPTAPHHEAGPATTAHDGGATPQQQWHTYRQEQNERTLPVLEAEARLEFRGEELTASWNKAYDTFAENNVFGGARIPRDGHQMRNAHWQWRHDITQQFRAEVDHTGRISSEAFDRIVHDAKANAHKYVVRADQKTTFAAVVKERIDSYKGNRFGDGELLPDFEHAPTKAVFDKDLNRFVRDDSKLYGHPDDGTAAPGDPFRDRSHDYNVLEQYYLAKEAQLDGILDRYLHHGETGGGLPARTGREIDTLVAGVSDDIGAVASRERDIRTATGERFDDVIRWNSRGRDALSEDFVAKVRQDFEYDLRTDHDLVFRHGNGDGPRALWGLRTSRAIDELPGRIAKEHFVRAREAEETAFAQNHLSRLGEDFLGRFGEGGRERVVAEYLDAVRATAQRHFDERLDGPAKAGETAPEWSGARDDLRTSLPDRIRHEGDLQAVVGEAAHTFHEIAGHPGSTEALTLYEDTLSRLGNDFRTERVARYDELFAPEGHRTAAWLSHESRGEDGFQARLDDLRTGDFIPELRSWSYPAFRDWRADSATSPESRPAARPGTPDRPVPADGNAAPEHRTPTTAREVADDAPAPSRSQTQTPARVETAAQTQTQTTLDRNAAGANTRATAHDLPAEVGRIVRRSSDLPGARAQTEHAHQRLLEQRPDIVRLPAETQATLVADELLRAQEQMRRAASEKLLRYTDRYPDNQRIHQVHQELFEQFGTEFQDLTPAQRADLVVARTLDESFGRPTTPPHHADRSVDPADTARDILAEPENGQDRDQDQDRVLRELRARDPLLRDLTPDELRDAFLVQEHTAPVVANPDRHTRLHHLGRIGRELHLHGAEAAWDLAARLSGQGDRTGLFTAGSEAAVITSAKRSTDPVPRDLDDFINGLSSPPDTAGEAVDDLLVHAVNDLLTGMGKERVPAWRVREAHQNLDTSRGPAFSRGNSAFRAEAVAAHLAGLPRTARAGGARDALEQRPPRTRADDTTVVDQGKGKGRAVVHGQADETPEFVQGSASSGRMLEPDPERVSLDQALREAYEDEDRLHGLPIDAAREAFRIRQSEGSWIPGTRLRERLRELADIGWEVHRNGPEAARELAARLARENRRDTTDRGATASQQPPRATAPTVTEEFPVPVTVWRYDRTALPHTHTGQQGTGLWRDVRNPSRTATSEQLGLGPGHREHGDQFDEVTDRVYGSGNVRLSTLGDIPSPDRWANTVRRVLPDAKRRVELALRELRAADGAPQETLLDALASSFPLFQRATPQEAAPFLAHLTEVLERVGTGLDSGTAAVTLVGRTSYHLAAALAEKAGAVGWVDPVTRDVTGRLLDPHRMKRDEIAPVFARKGAIHLTKANDKDWDLAWTLVHEATHRYAGTDDYQYSSYEMERVEDALGAPRLENRQARDPMTYTGADESVLPAKQHNWYAMGKRSLMNADSFAQFVMTLTGERHAGLGRWYAGPGVARPLGLDADLTQRVNRRLTRLGHGPVDAERAVAAYRELAAVGNTFAHLDFRARVERTAQHVAGLGSDLSPGGAKANGRGAAGQKAPVGKAPKARASAGAQSSAGTSAEAGRFASLTPRFTGAKEFAPVADHYALTPVAEYDGLAKYADAKRANGTFGFVATVPATKDVDLVALADRYAKGFRDGKPVLGRFGLVVGLNGREADAAAVRAKVEDFRRFWEEKGAFPVSVVGFTWVQPKESLRAQGTQKEIPYGAIREAVIRDRLSTALIDDLNAHNEAVYLHVGDADVQSMNVGGHPLFDTFAERIRATDDELPEVVSGGYRVDGTDAVVAAGDLDLAVRSAMAKVDPRSVYFPEPNMFVRISGSGLENSVHFGAGSNRSDFDYGAMEGRRLFDSVLRNRQVHRLGVEETRQRIVFDPSLALVTDSTRIGDGIDGTVQTLDRLTQSHGHKRTWTDQVQHYLTTYHPSVSVTGNGLAAVAFHGVHEGNTLKDLPVDRKNGEILKDAVAQVARGGADAESALIKSTFEHLGGLQKTDPEVMKTLAALVRETRTAVADFVTGHTARQLGASGATDLVRPHEELRPAYAWLEDVNPFRERGAEFGTNCVLTAIAVDFSLREGATHQAAPSRPGGVRQPDGDTKGLHHYLANYLDRVPDPVHGVAEIVEAMSAAPVGARGMAVVERVGGRIDHVVNVLHDRNGVVFLDGQSGTPVHAPERVVAFLPTTEGIPGHPLHHGTTAGLTAPSDRHERSLGSARLETVTELDEAPPGADSQTPTATLRPTTIGVDLEERRPPRLDRELPPAPTTTGPVKFTDGTRLPVQMAEGVGTRLTGLPPDVVRRSFAFGQSDPQLRGIDQVVDELGRRLATRESTRPTPPKGQKQGTPVLLEQVSRALRDDPRGFFGDGKSFSYRTADGRTRLLRVTARPYGTWERFTFGYANPVKNDVMRRTTTTGGQVKANGTSFGLAPSAPLGPLKSFLSPWARLHAQVNFGKQVKYNQQRQVMNQTESRASDASNLHVDDVWYAFSVHDRSGRPVDLNGKALTDGDTTRRAAGFGFAVRDGLKVRIPDSMTSGEPPAGELPERMTMTGDARYRLVSTEDFGPVGHIHDWVVEQAGAGPGTVAAERIGEFFSTSGFHAMSRVLNSGPVFTPPLLGGPHGAEPLGVFTVRVESGEAVLISETKAAELRDIVQSTSRDERQVGKARTVDVGAVLGPAFQLFDLEGGALGLRAQAGLTARYAAVRNRGTVSGGTTAVKIAGQAKSTATGLYLVHKTVTVTAPPNKQAAPLKSGPGEGGRPGKLRKHSPRNWSEEPATRVFDTYAIERMTRTEARRLAGLDKTPERTTPEPRAPRYLTENDPTTLGMSRVEEFTFTDGSVGKVVDGRTVTFPEHFADAVLKEIGRVYPDLVAPLRELNPDHPRWRGADHFKTVLNNTLEVYNQLAHHSLATNVETMMTTGLRIDLVESAALSRGHRYVWIDARLTGRRYEGDQQDVRVRFSAPGTEAVGGRRGGSRGGQVGVEGMLSLSDPTPSDLGGVLQTGTLSAGVRAGGRTDSESGYGLSAANEQMSYNTGGSHLYSYDLRLEAKRGGYSRPRRWMRGLVLLNVLGTQPFVFGEPESPLFTPRPGTEEPAGLGRVLLSVPVEHTPAATPDTAPRTEPAQRTQDVPETPGAPETRTVPGTAPQMTRQEALDLALGTGKALEESAGRPESVLASHPHQTVSVTSGPEMVRALETTLDNATGRSWTAGRKGAPVHDAAIQLTDSKTLRANHDQAASPMGWRAPELWAAAPYLNRSTWLAHRTTVLPGLTALTRAETINSDSVVGGTLQASGRSARTGTLFFGGQVGFRRTHDAGTGVTGNYGLVVSPYRRDLSTSVTVQRSAVSEVTRRDSGRHALVAASLLHEFAVASDRLGAWAHRVPHLPTSLASAAGSRVVVPDGLLVHVPEKSAHRLGALKDAFGDVPLYQQRSWSPFPWLRGAFGGWPVNPLNTAAALRRFEEQLAPLGLTTQDREQLRRLVSGRVMRAVGKEMSGGTGASVPARIGRWGAEWAETWVGHRQVRLRAQLVPVRAAPGAFGGLGHSVELEEARHAVESVQRAEGRSTGRLIGIAVTEGAHTGDAVVPMAGPSYTQTGSSTQTRTQTRSEGTVDISTVAISQAHGEYATRYELRLDLEITDSAPATPAPAPAPRGGAERALDAAGDWWRTWTGRRGHRISVQQDVGRLVEHLPMSLMRPDPQLTDGQVAEAASADRPDPLSPPELDEHAPAHRVELPRAFGAGGWHDVTHPARGSWTKPFEMPEQGFAVRGIVGLEGLHAANTLALGAAYDASLPLPAYAPLGPDLLARAQDTPLTRAGSGPAQSLEDGTSGGALAAFYGQTLTPDGYQVAGLTDRGFWGGADGSLTLYSKPDLSGARLLTVTDGAKFEHAHRSTQGAGASADRAGAAEHVLHAGPTTTSPALGTSQIGSGSGAQGLDSAASGQTGEQLASVNIKPDKARTFLFAIPTTWMAVAHVRHHVKDSAPARFVRSAFGNPQRPPQAVETEAKVLAWVREDVARQLGLINDTLFPAEVAASWDAVADAEKAWTAADENYWNLRRGDGFERESALAAAERTLTELAGGDPLPTLSVEDARAAFDALEREDTFAEPSHDGWGEVRDGRIELARAQLRRVVAEQRLNEVKADLDALRAHADALAVTYAEVREATDRLTNWHQLDATPQGRAQLDGTPAPPRATFTEPAAPPLASRKPPTAVTAAPPVGAADEGPSTVATTGETEGETRPAYSAAPWQRGQDGADPVRDRSFDAGSDHLGITATEPDGRRVFFDLHRPKGDGNGFYAAVLAARGSRTVDPASLAALVAGGAHIPVDLGLDPRAVFHAREVAVALARAFRGEPGPQEKIRERMSEDGGRLPQALRSRLTPQEIRGLVRQNLRTARVWNAETAEAAARATARTLAVDLTVVEENGTHTSYSGAVDDTSGPLPEVTVHRRGDAYLAAVPRTARTAGPEPTAGRRALRQLRLARAAALRGTLARSAPAERLDAMREFAGATQTLAEEFTRQAAFRQRIDGAGSSADTRSAAAHAQVLDSALSRFDAAERRMEEVGLGDLSGRDDPLIPAELRELPASRFLALMDRAAELLGSPAVVFGTERVVREEADTYRTATVAVAAELLQRDDASARTLAADLSERLGTGPGKLPGGAVTVGGHDLTRDFWETARDLEEGLERDLERLRAQLDQRIQQANAPEKAPSVRSRVSGWFGKRSRPVGPVVDPAEEIEELRDEIATLPAEVLREQRKHLADLVRHIERSLEDEYRRELLDEREWREFRAGRDRIRQRLSRLIVEPTGHRGHHDLLGRSVGRHPDFGAKRQDIKVDTYSDLARGVVGWIAAKPNRHAEKELALRVESEGHVEPVLDVLLTRIHTHVQSLPGGPRMLDEMEAGLSHVDGTPLGAYLRYFDRRNLPDDLAHLATTVGDRGGMAGVLRNPAEFGFRDKMMVLHDLMEYFKASPHYPKTYGSGLLPEDTAQDQQATVLVGADGRRTHSSAHRGQNVLRDGTRHPSTRDEHAPSTILARTLRIPVWAGQSNTAMRMFKVARWAGASHHEIAAEAWGIFAFWRLHYDHREALAYHTLHETMDVASNFGVPYSLTDRAAGLAHVGVEAALTEMETRAADLAMLAAQVSRAVRILSGREVAERVTQALDQLVPAVRTMSTSAAEIERGARAIRPRATERLTEPEVRTLMRLLDHERAGLAALTIVEQQASVVTAALQGGAREHGLDPRVEGWATGRGITVMAPRYGLLEREQECVLTGPAAHGGKAAEEFRSFSRPYPHASRSYRYEVGTAGTLVLPDGAVLTGDWTRFGDDFLHAQGFVLRGDHGWIGRVLNGDELREALPANPVRYSLTADDARMYLVPVGDAGRVVTLPLSEEHTATGAPVTDDGAESEASAFTEEAAITEEAESADQADLLVPERFRQQTTHPEASGLRSLSRVADLDRLLNKYARIDADDHALRAQTLDRLADRARAYAATTKDETRRRVVGRLAEQAEVRATRHRRRAEQASYDAVGTASTGLLGYRERIALAKRTWQGPVTAEVARLERLLLEAGPGARSLVMGAVPGEQVWAMNIMGEIRWLEQSTARVTRAPQTAQGVVMSIDLDPQARVIKPDPRLLAATVGGGAARFCELVLGGDLKHVV
ncbi:toxin glutamine deamidase domain-containing protein [Streptomyces sp. NPDC015408]|uniref:toxin glutamine deamidase domain-containing protein n=1 Tax=Streptomyces sp. NPDC015408 TaxID=3364956 RepID=UPI0036F7D3B8